MKFKKSIIALLLAVSVFLLNLPQEPVVAAWEDNNLIIQIGEKMTFDEGTLLKASKNLPYQQFYEFYENSSSEAKYNSILGNSYEGYLLPNYSQLSSEYKTALEASGYILPEDGKIKWVVERKENRTVAEETIGMDGPETYYRDFPVYKIYPYIAYDVSINSNIANGSIITDKPNATSGETVTLTIELNDYCQVDTITVKDANNNNITLSGTGNTRTFKMPESNVSVNGSFSKIPDKVQVDSTITNGSIKVDKPYAASGETVTLTVAPSDNYKLESIAVKDANNNNITLSGTGNTRTFTMSELNVLVNGSFQKISNNVGVDSNIANGSITVDKTNATKGEKVTITILPNNNYQLESITVNNVLTLSGTGNIRTFIMPELDVSVTGSFSKIPYNVGVDTSISNGSIVADKPNAKGGETVTLTVAPSDNYKLEGITVKDANNNDITLSGTGNTRTFTMPESNVSVMGSFLKIPHNVQVDTSFSNGSITVDKPNATGGETVTLTVVPSDNYELEGITVKDANNNDITLSGTGNTRTFTMPESNVLVTGSFFKTSHNVQVDTSVSNGSIVADKPNAKGGEIVTLTVAPSDNYQVESITVKDANNNDIIVSGTGNTRTFTMPESNISVKVSFSKILSKVDNVVLTPEIAVVQKGKMQAFTASVIGNNNPDKSVKWSIEGASSNSTTISESGVLQVSSDEMSSTLNVKATSILDNTKSSVAVVKVIRANLIPDTKSNTIAGIKEGDSYIEGTEIEFAVVGGGMDNTAPINGDVRYVPISWSTNSNGEWTTAPYTAKFTINNVGNYTLKVSYQKQTFNGTSWENIANEIDTKTVSFSIINKPSSDQELPNSGDQASTIFFLCVGLIAAVSTKHIHSSKKKL